MAGKFSNPRGSAPTPAVQSSSTPTPSEPRKGPRTGTLIFYTAYVMLIVFFIVGMRIHLKDLDRKLVEFEHAQPHTQSQLVFEELFTDPDWALLYDLAQIPDTRFDGREEYAQYMEATYGSQTFTYRETHSGLRDIRTYDVVCGNSHIGSFTLTTVPASDPVQWCFGALTLLPEYTESVRIEKLSGHTVYVNGIALEDSYTVRSTSVCADEYLPRGVYNVWVHTQLVEGLMVEPQVTAVDELGQPVDVVYDPVTDTYITGDSTTKPTDEESQQALDTLKQYVRYQVDHLLTTKLDGYFDLESPFYLELLESEPWMASNFPPTFADERITAFYRCSEDVFCVWVDCTAFVKRNNGTVKEYHVAQSMLFQYGENGLFCIGSTDRSAQWLEPQVRITFMSEDMLLSSELYPESNITLQAPLLGTASADSLCGWLCADTGMVFTPDSNGLITLPEGMTLSSMVLYAQYNTNSEVSE